MLKIICCPATKDFITGYKIRSNVNRFISFEDTYCLRLRAACFLQGQQQKRQFSCVQKNYLSRACSGATSDFPKYIILSKKPIGLVPKRNHSLQSNVESFAKTHTGIFKAISESTPVEYCQKLLLFAHDFTGLPWWATIICTTVFLRAAITLPLAVYQYYIMAKLENLQLEMPDIVNALKRETAVAVKMLNWDEKTARAAYNISLKKQWNNLIVRDNCHPFKASFLLWFQIPMWISLSISLRNLVYMLPTSDFTAEITYAELSVGGFGVIPNLVVPDVSWIFPVSLGLLNLAIIEMQILSKYPSVKRTKIHQFLTNTFRVFSVLMIPLSASVPSCLVLYWTTSSAFGLAQNLILLNPKVRRLCKIPETASEVEYPYQMIVSNLKTKLKIS